MKTTSRISALAFVVLIAACGDSAPTTTTTTVDPNANLRAYVAAVMANEASASELPVEDAEAACVAAATFDEIGAGRFVELGFDPDSATTQAMATFDDAWSDTEWETLIDALFGCLDMEQKLADSLADTGLDEAAIACISEDYFTSGDLRIGMLDRAGGEAARAAQARLQQLFADCGP